MTKPVAADLRADTRIDWPVKFGLPVGTPDPLDFEIDVAWMTLGELTGRGFEAMGPEWDSVILRAVTLMVVYQAATGRGDFATLFSQMGNIISFTVPGYSETRAATTTASNTTGRDWFFHTWKPLDMLIWLLATQEKRDEMMALLTGKQVPFLGIAHPEESPALFGIERDLLQ